MAFHTGNHRQIYRAHIQSHRSSWFHLAVIPLMSQMRGLSKRRALPGSCPSKRALHRYRQRSSPTSEGRHFYLARAPSIPHLPSTLGHQKRGGGPPESPHLGLNQNVLPFESMDVTPISASEYKLPQDRRFRLRRNWTLCGVTCPPTRSLVPPGFPTDS